jgi:hypothetical protein
MPTATRESPATNEKTRATIDGIIRRYPRLTAHLICKSLGYFCPRSAANAIAHHINGEPYFCEWYCDWAAKWKRNEHLETDVRELLIEVGRRALEYAARQRHHHKGYMAEYSQAMQLVLAEREAAGCTSGMLASWF